MSTITLEGVETLAQNNPEFTFGNKPEASQFGVGYAWFSDVRQLGYSDGVSWSFSKKPVRSTPVKIALFGDSTATTGTYTSNDNCEVIDFAFPASGTTTSSVTSQRYLTFLNYPCIMLKFNAGIGGQTTTDMLARDDEVYSVTRKAATDVANANVDCIILRGGSINNFSEGIYTQQDIDDRVTLHKQVLSRLMASGVAIIDEGIAGYKLPTDTLTANQIGKLTAMKAFNIAIRDYIKNLNNPLVVFMSPWGITCDDDGRWLPNYSTDGTHPEILGQEAISRAESFYLTALFGPSSNIRYPGTNLATNPLLNATAADGSGRGTVATGFSIPADSANRTFTDLAVEIIDGKPMQSLTYHPLGQSVHSCTITMPMTLANLNITSGDILGVEFDVWYRMVDGSNLPVGSTFNTIFSIRKTANGTVQNTPYNFVSTAGLKEFKGHVVLNKFKVNDNQANLDLLTFTVFYSPAAGVGTLVGQNVRISIGGVRVVKTTL